MKQSMIFPGIIAVVMLGLFLVSSLADSEQERKQASDDAWWKMVQKHDPCSDARDRLQCQIDLRKYQ